MATSSGGFAVLAMAGAVLTGAGGGRLAGFTRDAAVGGIVGAAAAKTDLDCGAGVADLAGIAATGAGTGVLAIAAAAITGSGDGDAFAGSTGFVIAGLTGALTGADFVGMPLGAGLPGDAVKVVREAVDIAEAVGSDAIAGMLANTSKAVSARRTYFGKVLGGLPRLCASIMAASIRGKIDHGKQKFRATCRAL